MRAPLASATRYARPVNCPRCASRLAERLVGACQLHGCPSCGGVWLSANDSARLAERFPLEAVQMAEAAANATARVETSEPLRCPTCAEPLQRNRFRANATGFQFIAPGDLARASELVELDVCANDGTFFDGGELPRAARAIHVPKNNGPGRYMTLDGGPRHAAVWSGISELMTIDGGFDLFADALSIALSWSDED